MRITGAVCLAMCLAASDGEPTKTGAWVATTTTTPTSLPGYGAEALAGGAPYFEARAAIVPPDSTTGTVGLVIAGGFDHGAQQSAAYLVPVGERMVWPETPSWSSLDSAYNTAVALGDIDGDGGVDIVIGALGTYAQKLYTGDVRAYSGCPSGQVCDKPFSRRPRSLTTWTPATGLALLDIDGDGDLDLAAAVPWDPRRSPLTVAGMEYGGLVQLSPLASGDLSPSAFPLARRPDGPPKLLRNDGAGNFSEVDLGGQTHTIGAVQVIAADVDRDGHLDLVWTGLRTSIWFGTGDPASPFPRWWRAEDEHGFSFDAAVWTGTEGEALVVVSRSCALKTATCTPETNGFYVYRVAGGATDGRHVQKIRPRVCAECPDEFAAAVALADVVGGDGLPELLAGLWTSGGGAEPSNHVPVFRGVAGERPFDDASPPLRLPIDDKDDKADKADKAVRVSPVDIRVVDVLPADACGEANAAPLPEIVVIHTESPLRRTSSYVLRPLGDPCRIHRP